LIPAAPGTWGSLGAVLVAGVLLRFTGFPPWGLAVLAALMTPLGIWAAERAAKEEGKKDPGLVVVDEVLGQWLVLAAMNPLSTSPRQWIAAFALFRIFDIWKPFPVRRLEKLPGGTGIVADDLGAGIYGALVILAARALSWL
jgi:phosphatidylglycerophosphatase A